VFERAIQHGVADPRLDAQAQPFAQCQQPLAFNCQLSRADLGCLAREPTMPGTFNVPERMPRLVWPPPSMMGVMRTRGLRRT